MIKNQTYPMSFYACQVLFKLYIIVGEDEIRLVDFNFLML